MELSRLLRSRTGISEVMRESSVAFMNSKYQPYNATCEVRDIVNLGVDSKKCFDCGMRRDTDNERLISVLAVST